MINDNNKKSKIRRIEAKKLAYRIEQHNKAVRQREFKKLREGIIQKYVAEELDLEDRQAESIFKLTDTNEDLSHGYFHACTAFGKTYLMMALAESYRSVEKDKKIIVLEENAGVLKQVKQDFIEKTSFNEDVIGAYYGKEKSPNADIIIATYASMEKMIEKIGKKNIGLVLCDEAHHILSDNRQRVAKVFDTTCLYGFSATPDYDADKGCEQVFGTAIDTVSLKDGIEEGLLCGFKNVFLISKIPVDLTETLDKRGDYDADKLEEILNQSHFSGMREELATFYLGGADRDLGRINGKTTIINVPSQKEAERLAQVFNEKAESIIAKPYHANTSDEPLKEFNESKFPVLIQVNRITEGYSNEKVEFCINYPTTSRVRETQRGGRALRRDNNNPNKKALIMDVAFKKSNEKGDLEEIRKNQQVLFMDIAEDIMYYSRTQHAYSGKQSIEQEEPEEHKTKLFKIVTDYNELYELVCEDMISQERYFDRKIHLKHTDFLKGYRLIKDGKILGQQTVSEIKALMAACHQENPELVMETRLNGSNVYFFEKRHLDEILKLKAMQGCDIKTWAEINTVVYDKNIHIRHTDFLKEYRIVKNGKVLSFNQRNDIKALLKACYEENPSLVLKSRISGQDAYMFEKARIEEVLSLKTMQGCKIKTAEELSGTPYDENLHIKHNDFYRGDYRLLYKGKPITSEHKSNIRAIFEACHKENPELVLFSNRGNTGIYIFEKSRLNEVLNLASMQDYQIKTLSEIYGEVLYNGDVHLRNSDFSKGNYRLIKEGKVLNHHDNVEVRTILAACHAENPSLVIETKTNGRTIYIFEKTRIDEVLKLKTMQGYQIKAMEEINGTIPFDKEKHIAHPDFYKNYRLLENGRIIDNYSTIRSIFEACRKENPDLILETRVTGNIVYMFEKERMSEVAKLKAMQGYQMKTVEEINGIVPYDKEKHLAHTDFRKNYRVMKNGKILAINNGSAIKDLFKACHAENPNLVMETQITGNTIYFFEKECIAEVLELKTMQGCDIKTTTEINGNAVYDKNIHLIQTDLYVGNYRIIQNGKTLTKHYIEKIKGLLEACHKENSDLVMATKASGRTIYFFEKKRLDEVLQLQTMRGCQIKTLVELNGAVSYDKNVHLAHTDFYKNYRLIKDGKIVTASDISAIKGILENCHKENPNLVYRSKILGTTVYIFDKERLGEVLNLHSMQGYEVINIQEHMHVLLEKSLYAQNPEEKKEYFEKARRFFNKMHPQEKDKENAFAEYIKNVHIKGL